MPKGYVILTEAINDRDKMAEYGRAAGPTIEEFEGKVLVATQGYDVIEGSWHGNQTVVVEFESLERARAWYGSDSYRAAAAIRRSAADCNAIIVEGFTPRVRPPGE